METNRIFSLLLKNPDVSAKALAELANINVHTVKTVLQRYDRMLSKRSVEQDGKRGRPELLYRVDPEWIPTVEVRWALAMDAPRVTALERALTTLESASLVSVDTNASYEEKQNSIEIARLRAKAARALLEDEKDEVVRGDALARIENAEKRYPTGPAEIVKARDDEKDPILDLLRRWTERLTNLGEQYGAKIAEASLQRANVALVLDLLPQDEHAPQIALLDDALRKHDLLSVSFPVMNLSAKRRESFLRGLEELALDPMANLVPMYVLLDSGQLQSKNAWKEIDRLCHSGQAWRAMEIASNVLSEATQSPEAEVKPTAEFISGIMQKVIRLATDRRSLRSAYGSSYVFDVKADSKFKAQAQQGDWTYERATKANIPKIIASDFEV